MSTKLGDSFGKKRVILAGTALLILILLLALMISPLIIPQPAPLPKSHPPPPPEPGTHDSVTLTSEEQAYLSRTGAITMCVDPEWDPYELVTPDGEYQGIAADLVRLIANRSGVSLELVQTQDWDESVVMSQEGRCQIIPFLTQTPLRDEWLLFTDPYFTDPNVIITRNEHEFIADPARLMNETITLPNGTSVEERIRRDYPNLAVVHSGHDEADAFRMVEEQKADMTVRSLTMAAYTIRKEGFFNLKIAGQIPGYSNEFRIGVAKDEPILRDILNKGVQTITPREVQEIINRHISIEVNQGVDWELILRIVLFFSLLIIISLVYSYHLRRLNSLLATRQDELLRMSQQVSAELTERIRLDRRLQAVNDELIAREGELRTQLEVIEQAEREIRYSEERFRLIAESSTDVIWVMNLDGTFSYVSPSIKDLTGYSAQEAVHQRLEDMVTPQTLGTFREVFDGAVDAYKNGAILPVRVEYEMPCKDGTTVWVEDRAVLIAGDTGTPSAFIGVTRDISERRRAAIAIKENEEKFIAIFEGTPDPILIISKDLRVIDANQGFLRRFGYADGEPAESLLSESFLGPIADLINKTMTGTAVAGALHREEMVLHTRAGLPFIAEVAVSMLQIPTEPIYLVQIHDIDEIRRAHDAANQANRKLNILSSVTRHDILNRIMVTSVYSEELRQDLTGAVQLKQINAIIQSNKEINALIAFTGQYQDLGVQAPVWQQVEKILMRRTITGLLQGVRLSTSLDGLEVYADQMLEKVLFNLVENSIRHGQTVSEIVVRWHEESGDAIIQYEDDGCGISEEDKSKIFKKGFGKNTGLGLFLIREILSITGITITEDGEPGEGVRFAIRVPKGKWREQMNEE